MKVILIFALLSSSFFVKAQSSASLYETDKLSPEFHAGRRALLREKMEANSIAVIFANPERNRANDVDYPYWQDPNFYYLTGFNEPNAVLVLFKDRQKFDSIETSEIIFVQKADQSKEVWTGKIKGPEKTIKEFGLSKAYLNTQFASFGINFKQFSKVYHSTLHDDVRDDRQDPGDLYSLIATFNKLTEGMKQNKSSFSFNSLMAELREIKTPEELVLLKKAISITCDAHLELMKSLDSAMSEYKAQAIIEFGFNFNGAEDVGYPSIVGSGENSCILHYTSNRKHFENKDLLVTDAGASYHGYTADVTRTLPVKGAFSKEQKLVYEIVLNAQEAGIKACKKGASFRDTHTAASEIIKKGLMELGIIKSPNDFFKYFFHGTSHYLGLDVHDPGTYGKLKPGSVITVEPGIYIPEGSDCDPKWWNIGVRIEDDVLITEGEPEVLSGSLPKKTEEIEKIMQSKGFFEKK